MALCASCGTPPPPGGRVLEWRSHPWDPAWGEAPADRTDAYALLSPKGGPRAGAPLLVALHARCGGSRLVGGARWSVMRAGEAEANIYQAPDGFYILYPDCMAHKETDFWWCGLARHDGPAPEDCARLARPSAVERRVMAEIEEVVETCRIDRNRIYIAGNSMGGQAALAYALAHPDVFAAACGNVTATVWFPLARGGLVDGAGALRAPAEAPAPDPPYCVDWSGSDDPWSRGHDLLYAAFAANAYPIVGFWGDFGHCLSIPAARRRNPLVGTFDWLSIRRDECYPVFANASSDTPLPWPEGPAGPAFAQRRAGQVNGYFRWKVLKDADGEVSLELRLAAPEELAAEGGPPPFAPARVTADVTLRRVQCRAKEPGARAAWRFGARRGEAVADARGLFTFPGLVVTAAPKTLTLAF